MEQEFDFKEFGKKENYKVPNDFFDDITSLTLQIAKQRERKSTLLRRRIVSGVSVAAVAIFAFFMLVKPFETKPVTAEDIVALVSDSEINDMLTAFEADTFYDEN